MATETWYVMEDGSMGDPRDVSSGDDGILRHEDGRVVAYAPHGPRSRAVEVDTHRKRTPPATANATPPAKPKDMQAEKPRQGYKTRQTKTRR
ncbi:hypothetical protein [Devosia sp. Root635]|uniref:hypothetical protein n=1 Tax=Devosia sp. Root635 TaxID=1736575 RepID=UPI0006FADEAC|nr:hypothetical protein [Devosia sp. Root635]KRA42103.1 hypothetical protein ASD80_10270 [Devosia sp. Root635]